MQLYINMIGEDFEQDVGPLIKSFFPGAELVFLHSEGEAGEADLNILFFLNKNDFRIEIKGSINVSDSAAADDHRAYRNSLLRALYRLLAEYTGKTLPWGILTGVRPTKLIMDRLELCDDRPLDYMRENYLVSEEKLRLGLQVATREKKLLDSIDYKNGYSIYIGIPFCPSICNYCSFGSTPLFANEDLVEPYISALTREIQECADLFENKRVSTLYFGGGTPTTLSASMLERVICTVLKEFSIDPSAIEFTVEAGRPDTITYDKLLVLKDMGVGRISINPQTMVDRTLQLIGRRHTSEEVDRAFALARKCGHDNINMDLIIGLSGEKPEDVSYTLSRIEALDPESLTVHTLARKRAARLTTEKEQYEGLEATNVLKMQELTSTYAADHGYLPYYMYRQKNMSENLENTGYSKEGYEGLYNILIMEEKQTILAFGAGASTKVIIPGAERFGRVENVKNVREYLSRVDEMIARKRNYVRTLKS